MGDGSGDDEASAGGVEAAFTGTGSEAGTSAFCTDGGVDADALPPEEPQKVIRRFTWKFLPMSVRDVPSADVDKDIHWWTDRRLGRGYHRVCGTRSCIEGRNLRGTMSSKIVDVECNIGCALTGGTSAVTPAKVTARLSRYQPS